MSNKSFGVLVGVRELLIDDREKLLMRAVRFTISYVLSVIRKTIGWNDHLFPTEWIMTIFTFHYMLINPF
jgi:hypothetical protein